MPQLAAVCGRKEAEVRDHKLGDGVSTQNLPRDLTASRSTMDQHLPQSLLSTSLHHVPQVNNGASGCHLEAPNLLSSPYTPPPTHAHGMLPPPQVCKPSVIYRPGCQQLSSCPPKSATPHTAGKFLPPCVRSSATLLEALLSGSLGLIPSDQW